MKRIGFNRPHLTGEECTYIQQAAGLSKLSGDGFFTRKCQQFFQDEYGFKKCLLTTSCTDALEMAAILLDIKDGDEVIMPSFTFVSTANPFVMRGANIVFADSREDHPGMNEVSIEGLITSRTRAIVVVHYAGVSCDMDKIMSIAHKHDLMVVEDAAQAIDSYYTTADGNRRALGSIGHLATFSFHESKNIISGEGGMLVVNDERFIERAQVIWEKGTNRSAYFRGEVNKYEWLDIGSSFLPSEITAAFLWAQLEKLKTIQERRRNIWSLYYERLSKTRPAGVRLPFLPTYASSNGHMFYLVYPDVASREQSINNCLENNIVAVFHYQSLHNSPFYKTKHDGRDLPYSDQYSDCLLRLPLYYDLSNEEVEFVCEVVAR